LDTYDIYSHQAEALQTSVVYAFTLIADLRQFIALTAQPAAAGPNCSIWSSPLILIFGKPTSSAMPMSLRANPESV
jgi:hypothetical protein